MEICVRARKIQYLVQGAINYARVGAQKIWAGTVSIHPNAKTDAHHLDCIFREQWPVRCSDPAPEAILLRVNCAIGRVASSYRTAGIR